MNKIISILIFIGVVLSFPISIILFTMNKAMRPVTRLLAVAFFSIGCYALSHFLFLTEWILYWPMYYRLVTPFYYLIPPCIFLYVYKTLKIDSKSDKQMWLHFLPALIMLVDILPWIFMGYQERYAAVRSIVVDHASIFEVARGFLPIWIHFVARPLLGLIYLFYQVKYILTVKKKHHDRFRSTQYKQVFRWVAVLTAIELVMYLSLTFFSIALIFTLNNAALLIRLVYLPAMLMCVSFIVAAFYLYLTPSLLYGYELVPYRLTVESDEVVPHRYIEGGGARMYKLDLSPVGYTSLEKKEISEAFGSLDLSVAPFSKETVARYKQCLEDEVLNLELFKRQGLTVHQLTKMCNIPSKALSYMLNNIYRKGFNDFINEYRVSYIVRRLEENDWQGLTLEGLAFEAGFSSRTTFFLAFKKIHQMSPSQYVAKLEKDLLCAVPRVRNNILN